MVYFFRLQHSSKLNCILKTVTADSVSKHCFLIIVKCRETRDLSQVVHLKTESILLHTDPVDPLDVLGDMSTNISHKMTLCSSLPNAPCGTRHQAGEGYTLQEQQREEARRQQQNECRTSSHSCNGRKRRKGSSIVFRKTWASQTFQVLSKGQKTKRVGSRSSLYFAAVRFSFHLSGIPEVLRNTRERVDCENTSFGVSEFKATLSD